MHSCLYYFRISLNFKINNFTLAFGLAILRILVCIFFETITWSIFILYMLGYVMIFKIIIL